MNSTVPVSATAVRNRRTALVVDDVLDMLDLLEIALNSADFSVLRASSAADALDTFEERADEIDLLMTDVRVGAESGLELARKLLVAKPSLQVLAISGFALDRKLVLACGQIEFLPKPFSTSELKRKLQSMFASDQEGVTLTISGSPTPKLSLSTNCRTDSPHESRSIVG